MTHVGTPSNLPRREFLLASATALAAAFLPESRQKPQDTLTFQLGPHLLTPELIQPSTSVILGETGLESLLWYEALTNEHELETMVNEMFPEETNSITPLPTVTEAPRREIIQHFTTLLKAKKQNTQLVATDTNHWLTLDWEHIENQLINPYQQGSYRVVAAGLATGALVGFLALSLPRKNAPATPIKPDEAKSGEKRPSLATNLLTVLSLLSTGLGAGLIIRQTQQDLISQVSQQYRRVNILAELGAKAYMPI